MDTQMDIVWDEASGTLVLRGELGIHQLMRVKSRFEALREQNATLSALDIKGLTSLDTAGAFMLSRWIPHVPVHYANDAHRTLVEMMASLEVAPVTSKKQPAAMVVAIMAVGAWVMHMRRETSHVLGFMGKSAVMMARALRNPKRLRIGAVSQQIDHVGIRALPIIGLIAFLISIVLAYQGVAQLRPYGGEQFTVNLVALSILREMGVLLTAIMVAGRSGSAFTAEIGVMKAREEVDALQVMGLSPFDMLVTPRLIAIIIALPLLTFYADVMGLIGGFIISHVLIDITLQQYLDRVHMAVSGSDLFVGMFKAPVFAFFIGVVGCMHGLRVTGSAESIGRETTVAVVKSIFLVLVLDAFFSILFEELGL